MFAAHTLSVSGQLYLCPCGLIAIPDEHDMVGADVYPWPCPPIANLDEHLFVNEIGCGTILKNHIEGKCRDVYFNQQKNLVYEKQIISLKKETSMWHIPKELVEPGFRRSRIIVMNDAHNVGMYTSPIKKPIDEIPIDEIPTMFGNNRICRDEMGPRNQKDPVRKQSRPARQPGCSLCTTQCRDVYFNHQKIALNKNVDMYT